MVRRGLGHWSRTQFRAGAISLAGGYGVEAGKPIGAIAAAIAPSSHVGTLRFGPWGPGFLRAGLNSILVAGGTVTASLLFGLPAAFALAKLHLRGSHLILINDGKTGAVGET